LLGDIGTWVQQIMSDYGYIGLFLLLLVENLFPPIPSEVILPLAGFLVGQGDFNFVGALVASTAGALVGAYALYALGRWGGRTVILRYGRFLRLTDKDLDRADGWFEGHGAWIVLFARMIPGIRSVISVPAGALKMPILQFTVLTTIGSALWNTLLIGLGIFLGRNWAAISEPIGAASDVVLVVTAVALAVALLIFGLRRWR
jgi:membrane protein DedA with SNARE-associated domain